MLPFMFLRKLVQVSLSTSNYCAYSLMCICACFEISKLAFHQVQHVLYNLSYLFSYAHSYDYAAVPQLYRA